MSTRPWNHHAITGRRSSAARRFTLLAAVSVALAACGATGPADPVPGAPRAVLAIANPPYGGVHVFATSGATADMESDRYFTIPASERPSSVVGGPDGRLYVASSTTGTLTAAEIVEVMTPDHTAGRVGVATATFSSPDLLNPLALAFDARGDLWVADGRGSTAAAPVPNHLLRFAAADLATVVDGGAIDAATVLVFAENPEGWWPNHLIYALHLDELDRLWYTDVDASTVGRIDGLAARAALETDVVPDLQVLGFDPAAPSIDAAELSNPVGLTLAEDGSLYVGSSASDVVVRFDGAGGWSGYVPNAVPDARLAVGIPRPRFVALDAEGGLWALTNGTPEAPARELVRVVGHATPTGDATLVPTERRTWATSGQVLGGGMRFLDR